VVGENTGLGKELLERITCWNNKWLWCD